jgi:predicted peptidase
MKSAMKIELLRKLALAVAILAAVLAGAVPAAARKAETGFLDRTVTVQGITYRYQVYVPQTWTKQQKWPVILFLHGYGERGDNGLRQTDVGLAHAIRVSPKPLPFVIVMPQCLSGQHLWVEPAMEEQALAALDQSIREFNGDRARVYLTGLSMGGYGTWDMAARYAGRFAAYVPICGGIKAPPTGPSLHVSLIDDPKVTDPYAEMARRIGKTPVWICHGADDPIVPVEEARKMAEALKAAGGNVKYTEYPGTGHNSWDKAYAEPELFPWLLEQRLTR